MTGPTWSARHGGTQLLFESRSVADSPRARRAFAALILAAALGGCANPPLAPGRAIDSAPTQAMIEALEEATATAPDRQVPEERPLSPEVMAVLERAARDVASDAERFDVSVSRAPAADFFRGLVAGTRFNAVVHPDVSAEITLDLTDVTLAQVMDVVRDMYGFEYVLDDRMYTIYPDAMRTEVFQVDYLNIGRSGNSEMQVSAGKLGDSGGSSNRRGGDGDSGRDRDAGGRGDSDGGRGSSDVVGTVVGTRGASDFWAELDATLRVLVGDAPGRMVVVTPQVGLIVVRALPSELRTVRGFLDQTELTLKRQVILEAKILEVTLNEGFESGIDWHTFGRGSGGVFQATSFDDGSGNIVTLPGSNNDVAGEFAFGSTQALFNPIGSRFAFYYALGDFEGMISLLSTQGTVQVLSSPRISTVNNQKAVIKVGNDEFFVTDVSTSTVTAGSAINVNDSPELTPFFSGIALDVTPQISSEGDVTLHIHPTVSDVREQRKLISGDSVPLAASSIRESDSIVRARDGQVIVIGGLMQTTARDNDAHVPGLGRLPLVGHLLTQRQQVSVKSELVILLRPTVVTEQTRARALGESLERIRALSSNL